MATQRQLNSLCAHSYAAGSVLLLVVALTEEFGTAEQAAALRATPINLVATVGYFVGSMAAVRAQTVTEGAEEEVQREAEAQTTQRGAEA